MSMNFDKYWNLRKTLTYNQLINIIVGNRGGGKTYGAKEFSITNFIDDKKKIIMNFVEHRQQFGYIRRYKEDLKKSMPTFFNDIAHEFPDYQFKVEGDKFYIRLKPLDEKTKWTDDDIAGYGFVLSTANNLKSVSFPFITLLIFDEFLLDKGNQHYLSDEPIKLLNLYETIARPGTEHPRVRLFLLANAISITNPYFLFWDLKMPTKKDRNGKYIWKHPTRPILVEDVRNELFIDEKRKSEFGTLVDGTKYADFSIENKFILDDSRFIEKKTSKAKYYFTFVYKEQSFGVWYDMNESKMWVSYDIDPSFPLVYSLTLKDHQPNTMLIKSAGKRTYFKLFLDMYKEGLVYFENMNVKNLTYEVIKLFLN